MLEEHVHKLPQHVVEGLHHLLTDVGVLAGRLELQLRAGLGEGDRQTSAAPGGGDRLGGLAVILADSEADRDVGASREQPHLVGQVLALPGEADRRQGALADDHGMDELDRHVAGVRARRGRAGQGEQAPAAGEALGHRVTEHGEPPRIRLEQVTADQQARPQHVLQAHGQAVLEQQLTQAQAPWRPPTRATRARPRSPLRCER